MPRKITSEKQKEAFISSRMRGFKGGEMHSGSKKGPVVKARPQAIAIILSEAREKGATGMRRRVRRG